MAGVATSLSKQSATMAAVVMLVLGPAGSAGAQCTRAERHKLLAADGAAGNALGYSVSLSGDRALVGAFLDDEHGVNSGAAYVFERHGALWVEVAKLTPSDATAGDYFGRSVSLSQDRALVGAHLDDDHGDGAGAAYVFELRGNSWLEVAKLTASDAESNDNFGFELALVGDRALISAYLSSDSGAASGSTYVFEHIGTMWVEMAKLVASDAAANDFFGVSVSLSGDRALVGAYLDDDRGLSSGSAYVFELVGSSWVETAKLTASDGAPNDNFGRSVSLSGDHALVGAPRNADAGQDSGSAYVFELSGTSWVEAAKLTASDASAGDFFGISVSQLGDRALVGAFFDDTSVPGAGSAYLFERHGTSWEQVVRLGASQASEEDYLGASVSQSGDLALVGAHQDDDTGDDSGAAYLFDLAPHDASWSSYGQGWPGTNGIPSFSAQSEPMLGATILLDLENSSAAATFAMLLAGRARASFPSPWDGTLLVGPSRPSSPRWFLRLSPGGNVIPLAIPNDAILLGKSITLQVLEADPGASKGVSFTAGLELVVGDCRGG